MVCWFGQVAKKPYSTGLSGHLPINRSESKNPKRRKNCDSVQGYLAFVPQQCVANGAETRPAPVSHNLLEFDRSSCFFEFFLEFFGFSLGDAFLDRLGSGFHQILGFLEAKTGDAAHFLDDVDFLFAS